MYIEIENHIINLDEILYIKCNEIEKEYIYIYFKNNTKVTIDCGDMNNALNVYDEIGDKLRSIKND